MIDIKWNSVSKSLPPVGEMVIVKDRLQKIGLSKVVKYNDRHPIWASLNEIFEPVFWISKEDLGGIKNSKKPNKSFYHVYKKLSDGKLEAMGGYQGLNPQDAINKMAEAGNLKGNEFICSYMAIPYGPHLKALIPKI